MRRVTVVRSGLPLPSPAEGERVVSFEEFVQWIRRGSVLAHLGRYADARLVVWNVEAAGRPLPLGLALRAMSRGAVALEDLRGRRKRLTASVLARWTMQAATEPFRVTSLLRRVAADLDTIEREDQRARPSLDLARSPLYLRTDLSFGVRAGGSVAHTAGVVNELDAFTGPVTLLTTDDIPTVKPAVRIGLVPPKEAFWNFRELPTFLLNDAFEAAAQHTIGEAAPAFVYQRYSLNNYAGIRIARRFGVPFVLEYNGSEIWMGRHWGHAVTYEEISIRIEQLNLTAADLIVVVSRAMRDEVVARGVAAEAVLVNPNGVDAERYQPDIDATAIRQRFGLGGRTVIGFIGTFGPWHGAEVLARAFVLLLRRDRSLAGRVRLLMIGDGARVGEVRRILVDGGAMDATVFTGLVPQEEGPSYLAACDLLVSPHVPNPDGSPFFGSPTKLFEYMATARGIVASNLDQIGEILQHGRTAWLVPPGDAEAVADAIRRLIDDQELRTNLGAAARREVLAHYTWREHTRRTIERLRAIVAS